MADSVSACMPAIYGGQARTRPRRIVRCVGGHYVDFRQPAFTQHRRTHAQTLDNRRDSMYSHLLVPTDGSKLSDKAIAQAIALAKA